MQLIRASVHTMRIPGGPDYEYARLLYRTAKGLLGRSVALWRLSPDLLQKARGGHLAG